MTDLDLSYVPGTPLLVALVGSHAYGTTHEDSDFDYRGVYACPTEALFRLDVPQETVDRKDPDVVIHELRKFARLAAAANPSVLEVLWAEPVVLTECGRMLVAHRDAFLSRRVFQTYGGYATQQLRKAVAGTGGSRGQRHFKREKFVGHIYRLMECGIHVLEHGDLRLRVQDPDVLMRQSKLPLERVEQDFLTLDARLRIAYERTSLPENPDIDRINSVLRTIRNMHNVGGSAR